MTSAAMLPRSSSAARSAAGKRSDTDVWVYDGFNNLSLEDFQSGKVDYGLGPFGNGISAGAIKDLIGSMDPNAFYDETESRIDDFSMNEDINAAYLMNTLDVGDWRFITGLRYEGTELSSKGTGLRDGVYVPTDDENRYDHWLPGVHARYKLSAQTQVRAAWTHSVVRPTFGQLAPGFMIDQAEGEASFGNPGSQTPGVDEPGPGDRALHGPRGRGLGVCVLQGYRQLRLQHRSGRQR